MTALANSPLFWTGLLAGLAALYVLPTTIAVISAINGAKPTLNPGPSGMDADSKAPACSRRLSAPKISNSPFCRTIESPKVTSSGGRISSPSTRSSTSRCSAKPTANIAMTVSTVATPNETPATVIAVKIR